jgi:hypothetical protein
MNSFDVTNKILDSIKVINEILLFYIVLYILKLYNIIFIKNRFYFNEI